MLKKVFESASTKERKKKKRTQSLLSHVHNNMNVSFQLKLDQALVQGSDKNIRYLFNKDIKQRTTFYSTMNKNRSHHDQSNHGVNEDSQE